VCEQVEPSPRDVFDGVYIVFEDRWTQSSIFGGGCATKFPGERGVSEALRPAVSGGGDSFQEVPSRSGGRGLSPDLGFSLSWKDSFFGEPPSIRGSALVSDSPLVSTRPRDLQVPAFFYLHPKDGPLDSSPTPQAAFNAKHEVSPPIGFLVSGRIEHPLPPTPSSLVS